MRQLLAFLLTTLLLASCGNKIPGDIISSERMTTIIWQLMESDEYVNIIVAKDSTKKSSTERMKIYQQVFELNKITSDEFKKSYTFYMEHPDMGKLIFDSITARAGRERIDVMRTKPDTLAQKADSIRRVRLADSLAHAKPDSQRLRPAIPGKTLLVPDSTNLLRPVPFKKRIRKSKPPIHP